MGVGEMGSDSIRIENARLSGVFIQRGQTLKPQ